MFNKKRDKQESTIIDAEIERVLLLMKGVGADTEEYNSMMDKLERLYKMKLSEQPEKKTVSPDALVAAGASLGGIVLILSYEKANVLTSKALSFVFKPKP